MKRTLMWVAFIMVTLFAQAQENLPGWWYQFVA